jgi:glycerol-3-phosphate dehydrogenase
MTDAMSERGQQLTALASRRFDLLVIGGGITGCGIAREAALTGLSVALVEKNDFASGTSSRSSRLIHGGVRYLEHGQLHLVFESSAERRQLLRLAPHLVHPLEFTWPVYAGARIPQWRLGAGLMLYDALSLFRNVGRHGRLSRRGVLEREPMLQPNGLLGGAHYYDAATNDARLTLANAIGAAEAGAVTLNHTSVTALVMDAGRVAGATIRDAFSERSIEVRASVVVNATGPWSDALRHLDGETAPTVRGSKGAHIAVPRERIGNRDALTLLSPVDGRVLFVLPADKHAIVGTTDSYTSASPDDVRATIDDVQYLLAAANSFFPAAQLTPNDVISAWAGIRPLVATGGDTPGAASREHAVTTSPRGLVSITGGKLTTYRVMAADVLDVVRAKINQTPPSGKARSVPLPGGDFDSFDTLIARATAATNDAAMARHLATTYGTRWTATWAEIQQPGGSVIVADGLPYTIGELRYAATNEMAYTLGDLLIRRTRVAFETSDHGLAAAERVAVALSELFGPNASARRDAIQAYALEAERMFAVES